MPTFITGLIVATGLYFALRHVYRNFRDGREDCAGGCLAVRVIVMIVG